MLMSGSLFQSCQIGFDVGLLDAGISQSQNEAQWIDVFFAPLMSERSGSNGSTSCGPSSKLKTATNDLHAVRVRVLSSVKELSIAGVEWVNPCGIPQKQPHVRFGSGNGRPRDEVGIRRFNMREGRS
jgi:hypothetical protein